MFVCANFLENVKSLCLFNQDKSYLFLEVALFLIFSINEMPRLNLNEIGRPQLRRVSARKTLPIHRSQIQHRCSAHDEAVILSLRPVSWWNHIAEDWTPSSIFIQIACLASQWTPSQMPQAPGPIAPLDPPNDFRPHVSLLIMGFPNRSGKNLWWF